MSQPTEHIKPTQAGAQAQRFITDELALGQRLNHAVEHGQRADFSYLLALLSDNVIEHSAFKLQRAKTLPATWKPPFAYGPSTPLQASQQDFANNPAAAFQQSRTLWRLQYQLQPEGLHLVNDAKHVAAEVVANCAHYVQQRLQGQPAQSVSSDEDLVTQAADMPAYDESDLLDIIDRLRGVDRAVA